MIRSKKTRNVPLYAVEVSGLDDATAIDLQYSSAKNYARTLDTAGMPATIKWYRTVSLAEWFAIR